MSPDTPCPTCKKTTPCECPDRKLIYKVPPAINTPPQPFPKAKAVPKTQKK